MGLSAHSSSSKCRVHGRPLLESLAGTPFCPDCRREAARLEAQQSSRDPRPGRPERAGRSEASSNSPRPSR